MDHKKRRNFSAEFKVKVVLEALKERSTIEELARKYELHPNQIGTWKKEFISKAANVFNHESDISKSQKDREELLEELYNQIGKQKVEIEWMKKKL